MTPIPVDLIKSLYDKWDADKASVLADWYEEVGFTGTADRLRASIGCDQDVVLPDLGHANRWNMIWELALSVGLLPRPIPVGWDPPPQLVVSAWEGMKLRAFATRANLKETQVLMALISQGYEGLHSNTCLTAAMLARLGVYFGIDALRLYNRAPDHVVLRFGR